MLRRLAIAAAITILGAAPACAQPAQAAEQAQLARAVAHELFTAMNATDAIIKGMNNASGALDVMAKYRPGWPALIAQSMREEVVVDEPLFENLFARELASRLSADELKAGLTIVRDPQIRAGIAAAAAGQPRPAQSGAPCGRACLSAIQSRPGRAFMATLANAKEMFEGRFMSDAVALLIPGTFRRFAEKTEPVERAAAAAP